MDCERAQEGTGKSGKGVCMILSDQLIVDNGDFVVEHLDDSTENRHSVDSFASGNNAQGLELYLKDFALNDELSNESRTYLVKDSLSKALACYFFVTYMPCADIVDEISVYDCFCC